VRGVKEPSRSCSHNLMEVSPTWTPRTAAGLISVQRSSEQFLRNKWYTPLCWLLQLTSLVTNWCHTNTLFSRSSMAAYTKQHSNRNWSKHACMSHGSNDCMHSHRTQRTTVRGQQHLHLLQATAMTGIQNVQWRHVQWMVLMYRWGTRRRCSNHSNIDGW